MQNTANCCENGECSSSLGPLSVLNLTEAARLGRLAGGMFDEPLLESASRAMYRSTRHVLIVGAPGVGKSTLVHELARRAVHGSLRHLSGHVFQWIDCRQVSSADGRAFLDAVATVVSQDARLIWCLDGLGHVLTGDDGRFHKGALLSLLERSQAGLIGVVSREEYTELLAHDADLLQRFTRVDVEEPNEERTLEMVQQHARGLSERFGLEIAPELVERTVALTSSFLLSERHPAKSIRLLTRVCEDLDFDRTQLGRPVMSVGFSDVVNAVAQRTGIPAETVAGEAVEGDFEAALTEAVVGQQTAIEEAARELRLIKAGLNEPGKPASVMLFAGMTGVGKTELAKRIAELYSSSRRLQTYTMANFTEPHSVSGIIGVPPGYVGFEHGGRLINELNADPYSVFLLDEAEKAHPNVWKPFLNLFDEGWIVDQRGVMAYADRAIFILTTNAGDRNIAQMTRTGKSSEEIVEHVKQALAKVRHERSSQPVFPPAFLARIGRIIVFNPLEEEAMIGIADRICRRMQRLWQQKRNKRIEIDREIIDAIGRRGHELNDRSGGREGGRIIKKLVADLLESRIQQAATDEADRYRQADMIRLTLAGDPMDEESTGTITVEVEFHTERGMPELVEV